MLCLPCVGVVAGQAGGQSPVTDGPASRSGGGLARLKQKKTAWCQQKFSEDNLTPNISNILTLLLTQQATPKPAAATL